MPSQCARKRISASYTLDLLPGRAAVQVWGESRNSVELRDAGLLPRRAATAQPPPPPLTPLTPTPTRSPTPSCAQAKSATSLLPAAPHFCSAASMAARSAAAASAAQP